MAKRPKARTKSEADPDGGKRIRTGIYRDGGKTLFVPPSEMHDARRLFADPQAAKRPPGRWPEGVNIRAIERQVGRGKTNSILNHLRRYAGIAWYQTWQRGAGPKNQGVSSRPCPPATSTWPATPRPRPWPSMPPAWPGCWV